MFGEALSYQEWCVLKAAFDRCSSPRRKAAVAILECLPALGENALALLVDQAKGLELGAPQYGDFVADATRDLAAEAKAEARDGCNYTRRKIVELKDEIAAWEDLIPTFTCDQAQAASMTTQRVIQLKRELARWEQLNRTFVLAHAQANELVR